MRRLALLLILAASSAFAQTGPVDTNGRPLVNVETGAVTADTEMPAAAAAADNASNPTAPPIIAFCMAWDGSTWDRCPGTAADGLLVNLGDNNDVTVTATNLDVQIGGSDSLTIGTFPDNEPINVAQVAGATAQSGSGTATGALRVELPTNGTGVIATVTNLTNLPNEGQQTAANSISVTPDTDNDAIGATGSAVPGEAAYVAGTDGTNLAAYYVDPCQREARTTYVVDIVTATTTEIANQVASELFYVCSVNLVTAGANNVAIVEDDTDACASPTAGLNGGVTAAEGWNFAANGGLTMGNGQGYVMKTGTVNRYWCIITSAAVQLSGTITYVSAP